MCLIVDKDFKLNDLPNEDGYLSAFKVIGYGDYSLHMWRYQYHLGVNKAFLDKEPKSNIVNYGFHLLLDINDAIKYEHSYCHFRDIEAVLPNITKTIKVLYNNENVVAYGYDKSSGYSSVVVKELLVKSFDHIGLPNKEPVAIYGCPEEYIYSEKFIPLPKVSGTGILQE